MNIIFDLSGECDEKLIIRRVDSFAKIAFLNGKSIPFAKLREYRNHALRLDSLDPSHVAGVTQVSLHGFPEGEKSPGNKAAPLIRGCDYVFCPEDRLQSYTNFQHYAFQSSNPFILHIFPADFFYVRSVFIAIPFKTIAIMKKLFSKAISLFKFFQ